MAVELNVGVKFETFSEAEKAVSDFCAQNWHAFWWWNILGIPGINTAPSKTDSSWEAELCEVGLGIALQYTHTDNSVAVLDLSVRIHTDNSLQMPHLSVWPVLTITLILVRLNFGLSRYLDRNFGLSLWLSQSLRPNLRSLVSAIGSVKPLHFLT